MSAPTTTTNSWLEQLCDALAVALHDLKNLETLILLGEGGLALRRELAEARVNGLREQLTQERLRRES